MTIRPTYDTVKVSDIGTSFDFGHAVNVRNVYNQSWEASGWDSVDSALDALNAIFQQEVESVGSVAYEAIMLQQMDQAWLVVDTGDGVIGRDDFLIKIIGHSMGDFGAMPQTDGLLITMGLLP